MSPSAAVLVCALELLGRSHTTVPIELVAAPPPHASPNVEAFVTHAPDAIVIVTSTNVFRDALADRFTSRHDEACRKLASIIVHEEWHLRYGPDERGAYEAQLMALQWLRASPETITGVRRSMAAAIAARDRQRDPGDPRTIRAAASLSGGESPSDRRPAPSAAGARDR